ncbi:MAG: PIG-L family deacetylase [Ilumatobacter sp.]
MTSTLDVADTDIDPDTLIAAREATTTTSVAAQIGWTDESAPRRDVDEQPAGFSAGRYAAFVDGPATVRVHREVAPGTTLHVSHVFDRPGVIQIIDSDSSRPVAEFTPCGALESTGLDVAADRLQDASMVGADELVGLWHVPDDGAPTTQLTWEVLEWLSGAPVTSSVDRQVVLAELSVDVLADVTPGASYRVTARQTTVDGEQTCTSATVLDLHGRPCATATAIWSTSGRKHSKRSEKSRDVTSPHDPTGRNHELVTSAITTPFPLPKRLLGVWAHPDDEAYLSAGLMGRVCDAGGSVTLLTATRGEHGTDDRELRGTSEFGATRERELIAATQIVGVHDIRFIGRTDGGCHIGDASAVARITATIASVQPDLVITFGPDGVTNHVDHLAVSAWTTAACHATRTPLLYATMTDEFLAVHRELHDRIGLFNDHPGGFGVSVPDDELALRAELNDAELDRKRQALAAHASQTPALAAAVGEVTYRTWWRSECFRAPSTAELEHATRITNTDVRQAVAWAR